MTRINVIPVQELTRVHLIAEYKEIMRIPGNINKSLNRKSKPFCVSEIPTEYKMGKGHVKFFFNKINWVRNRFYELVDEMKKRGYKPKFENTDIFDKCPNNWKNNYIPTKNAMKINRERIEERLSNSKSLKREI